MEYKCSICLDRLLSVNIDAYVTPCGHVFHKRCIENSLRHSQECPNCRTAIITGTVNKIHLDVDDELVYSDCSDETEHFLEEVCECEKQKKKLCLAWLKNLIKKT